MNQTKLIVRTAITSSILIASIATAAIPVSPPNGLTIKEIGVTVSGLSPTIAQGAYVSFNETIPEMSQNNCPNTYLYWDISTAGGRTFYNSFFGGGYLLGRKVKWLYFNPPDGSSVYCMLQNFLFY